jgi:hypothetical protein
VRGPQVCRVHRRGDQVTATTPDLAATLVSVTDELLRACEGPISPMMGSAEGIDGLLYGACLYEMTALHPTHSRTDAAAAVHAAMYREIQTKGETCGAAPVSAWRRVRALAAHLLAHPIATKVTP